MAEATIDLTKTLKRVRVPCAIADQHGTITWLNDAARAAFGDLEGKPFVSVVAPEYVPVVEREQQRLLDGAPATDYEVDVLTVHGRRRAQISSVPVEGGDACHAVFGVAVTRMPRRGRASAPLTPRQTEVLHLLSQGASTDDIAASLHLSKETVRNHVRHILLALGVHSRLEAVALAHRRGLLDDAE
ncbi:MAG TPA: LuxR C-terminal-related transcriptional regulator [Gaiellaceae bacterium]|nr:LuxR C-terminal-related transcriptional regulator [Gaiellaceae bacterium]